MAYRPWTAPAKNFWVSLCLLILVLPTLLVAGGQEPSYPLLTVALILTVVALTVGWGAAPRGARSAGNVPASAAFAAAAFALLALACVLQRWITLVLWNPFRTDMLVVIREAISRVLAGGDPYTTYRAYDAAWDMVIPYGPVLWAPFAVPHVAGWDLRVITLIGALFVPACCGWAAIAEAGRGRVVSSASWLLLLIALVASIDVTEYAVMGHTPAYWPLIPIFSVLVVRERWVAAAVVLGLLVAARSTMVALLPGFFMAVGLRRRGQLRPAAMACAAVAAMVLLPFVVWDPHSIWYDMVASYPKLMKEVVWPSPDHGVMKTFGLTGWLLSRQWGGLVEASQLAAMVVACGLTWRAVRRGAPPLPWMALGLFAFSMTCYWPVYYIYFDVFLLFASAAMAEALADAEGAGMRSWLMTLAALTVSVLLGMRMNAQSFPLIEMSTAESEHSLIDGFDRNRADGDKEVAPISGPRAIFALPRASRAPATVVIDARTPDGPAQRVEAMLNGNLLGSAESDAQWRTLRFPAPTSAWRVGFNRLELIFGDSHPTMSVNRIGVEP
ncbi:MAG: DUF2029 domain-containing protein [Acidobacteria bacterium]|nr:DUF2029 domain-containing protein [Acidobacteriota bacterium]